MKHAWWWLSLVLLAPLACAASVHAFLDRSHVSLGDTVTLNIRSSGNLGTPDLSPLRKDFQVLGTSRSSSVQIVNGRTAATSQLGIALKPLHTGTLTIPALAVGGAMTQPLALQVGAAPSGGTGKIGDPVYMETNVLDSSPFVGQQTVYTVRLFYLPGVDGSLGDPVANGARLIKLDRDHSYTVDRNGYTYKVIEYEWALIPERSGSITVRGPTFQGQQLAMGNPGVWFNNPNALLNGQVPGFGKSADATGPATRIDARAAPAGAGKPWLPARNVELTLSGLPANDQLSAGVPVTVTLTITASGQPADALPEPQLPPIADARVYPDRTRDSTDDSGQWLQGVRTRSFAIVPRQDGKLTLPAITLDWWDVGHGRAAQARLPARTLQVSGSPAGTSNAASSQVAPAATAGPRQPPHASTTASEATTPRPAASAPDPWRIAALASLALWLLAIAVAYMWWWRRGSPAHEERQVADGTAESAATPGKPVATIPATIDHVALQREALDAARRGDAVACEHTLMDWAKAMRPGMIHISALRDALADPAQRDALESLQRARWQGGDAAAACAAVLAAFERGLTLRESRPQTRPRRDDLPPLYPTRE